MAETELQCMEMINESRQGRAKLMIAYRLPFEEANLHEVGLHAGARPIKSSQSRMLSGRSCT